MKHIVLSLLILTALSACSDTPEEPAVERRSKAYNPWDTQMKTLEKSKGVEGMLQQGVRERDRQLQEQGG